MFVKYLGMEGIFPSSFTVQLVNHFQHASTWLEDALGFLFFPFSQQLASKVFRCFSALNKAIRLH